MPKLTDMLQDTFRQLEERALQLEQQLTKLTDLVRLHHEFRQSHDHDLYEPYERTPLFTLSQQALGSAPCSNRPYPPGTRLTSGGTLNWALGTINHGDIWEVQVAPDIPETMRMLCLTRDGVKVTMTFDLVELDEHFVEARTTPGLAPDLPGSVQQILDSVRQEPMDEELLLLLRDLKQAAKFAATCEDEPDAWATGAVRDAKEWQREATEALQKYLLDNPDSFEPQP